MEIMGLHVPGASFVNPNTPLRDALTARRHAAGAGDHGARQRLHAASAQVLDEKAFVNGIVGLNATGGSTNLTIHLIAMAAPAGIALTWDDFADLSEATPLLTPRLSQRQGRREPFPRRRRHGLPDPRAARRGPAAPRRHARVWGGGLDGYTAEPRSRPDGALDWRDGAQASGDTRRAARRRRAVPADRRAEAARRPARAAPSSRSRPSSPDRHVIEAPARIFHDQEEPAEGLQAPANSTATSSSSSASRARRRTACPSCTS